MTDVNRGTIRGAYVDEKGVRWDTNDADFEGYLSKQSTASNRKSNKIIL